MIKWEYSEENKLWSLYIDNEYMGCFDNYDYHKQRKIISALTK